MADEIPGLRAMRELRFPGVAGDSKVDGETTPEGLAGAFISCSGRPEDSGGGFEEEVSGLLLRTLKIAVIV